MITLIPGNIERECRYCHMTGIDTDAKVDGLNFLNICEAFCSKFLYFQFVKVSIYFPPLLLL